MVPSGLQTPWFSYFYIQYPDVSSSTPRLFMYDLHLMSLHDSPRPVGSDLFFHLSIQTLERETMEVSFVFRRTKTEKGQMKEGL